MTHALGGQKSDGGKEPLDLVPIDAMLLLARVLEFGAKKYAPWNWAQGFKWSRLYAAAQRHLMAFWNGEENDPETGLSHLGHALCCVAFMAVHQLRKLGEDDRHRWASLEPKPAEPPPAPTNDNVTVSEHPQVCGCGHSILQHHEEGCVAMRYMGATPDGDPYLVPCVCKQQALR